MKSKLGLLFICGMVALGGARTAGANECAEARQHLVIARRALQVHDYGRAIAEYQASYEQDGDPLTLIFLARTQSQVGHLSTAIDLYRTYLDETTDGHRKFYVEAEIDRLSTLLLEPRIEIFDDSEAGLPKIPLFDESAPVTPAHQPAPVQAL